MSKPFDKKPESRTSTDSQNADQFLNAQYLNLGTYRRDGTRADTPVWFAGDAHHLYGFSNREAWKLKRIRNNPRCDIVPCTVTGTPTGFWQASTASLLDDGETIRYAHRLLLDKYGWQMRTLDAGARLAGRINQRTWFRIERPTAP